MSLLCRQRHEAEALWLTQREQWMCAREELGESSLWMFASVLDIFCGKCGIYFPWIVLIEVWKISSKSIIVHLITWNVGLSITASTACMLLSWLFAFVIPTGDLSLSEVPLSHVPLVSPGNHPSPLWQLQYMHVNFYWLLNSELSIVSIWLLGSSHNGTHTTYCVFGINQYGRRCTSTVLRLVFRITK